MRMTNGRVMYDSHKLSMEALRTEFEALLIEGVQRKSFNGVEMLLKHESNIENLLMKHSPDQIKEKCPDPVVLASEIESNEFLKLFHKYEYNIPIPHVTNCDCEVCSDDKFGAAVSCMTLLNALSNPVWIALTSQDPFLTLFKLCRLSRQYKSEDDSFEKEYESISEKNIALSLKLLDEVKSGAEGACIMLHKSKSQDNDMAFVNLAIEYDQKEVVAHPVTQHFVASKVFDDIPKWKTSSFAYKIMLVLGTALVFPITELMHIFLPFSCCKKYRSIGMKPFVKFINGAASFITFLILLAIMGASKSEGIRVGKTPTVWEVLVLLWLIGFSFTELSQMYEGGISNYFNSGWNCIDICMDFLMIFSYITWGVLCFHSPSYMDEMLKFVDGMFALAIILSFFRLVYLCQITCYLGLLQLCLGKMIQVIFQFLFINLVVLFSFAVAMVYLQNASISAGNHAHEHDYENKSLIYKALAKNYDGLIPTLFTLVWAGFGMADMKTLKHFEDGSFIQLWVNVLFIVYYGVSMIVLLNMLIAMMNNCYEQITNNLETEHKFARTILWLEHIGDDQPHPVPFNLVPTFESATSFFNLVRKLFLGKKTWKERDRDGTMVHQRKSYKDLCEKLMDRYLMKNTQCSLFDDIQHDEHPENLPFIHKVEAHIEKWTQYPDVECSCGGRGSINLGFPTQEEQLYDATSDDRSPEQSNRNEGFYSISQL